MGLGPSIGFEAIGTLGRCWSSLAWVFGGAVVFDGYHDCQFVFLDFGFVLVVRSEAENVAGREKTE